MTFTMMFLDWSAAGPRRPAICRGAPYSSCAGIASIFMQRSSAGRMTAARPGGTRTSTPTGGRSCWRAAASWRPLRRLVRGAATSSRSRPPALQVSPGNEAHLHAFATELIAPDGRARRRSTCTPRRNSPARSCWPPARRGIFNFARVFRNRERGAAAPSRIHHAGMVSGRRALRGADGGLRRAAGAGGRGGRRHAACAIAAATADPFAAPERLTVAEAFERFAGIDLLATLDGDARRPRRACRGGTRRGRARRRRRHLGRHVQPRAGRADRAAISASAARRSSDEYPVAEAALARPSRDDPRVAERFELYACGVELANGFGELTDPAEQRRRFEAEMAEKAARLRRALSARRGFPRRACRTCRQASGIALGFDRLVMLATGATRIEQVLWTPVAGDDR